MPNLDDNIENALELIPNMPVTKLLDELRDKGLIPTITVRVHKETGIAFMAILNMGGVNYYFHHTRDNNKEMFVTDDNKDNINTDNMLDEEFNSYHIPFDGWEVHIPKE